MHIKKCDLCKKVIKGDFIKAGANWNLADLCPKCAAPVVRFLEKKKLLDDPDFGLELRPLFVRKLEKAVRSPAKTIPFEKLKKKYLELEKVSSTKSTVALFANRTK